MVYIQLLLYKLLDELWSAIGKLKNFLMPNRTVALFDLEEIIINRADRLGDAVISRPFLDSFIRKVRSLGWQGTVTIIASTLNESILKPLGELPNVRIITRRTDAMSLYDRSIIRSIYTLYKVFVYSGGRLFVRTRSRKAFVDLIDSVTEMTIGDFPEYKDAYWMSANRGPFSFLFDYTAGHRFAGSACAQLVEGYIDAFSEFFKIPTLREFVESQETTFYPDFLPLDCKTAPILLFVGVKEFRDFEFSVWRDMLELFSVTFPEREIHVLDSDEFKTITALRKHKIWRPNVRFLDTRVPLPEIPAFAAKYALVLGIDGGGINMMRSATNSLTLFTFGNPHVWGPYTLGKLVRRIHF